MLERNEKIPRDCSPELAMTTPAGRLAGLLAVLFLLSLVSAPIAAPPGAGPIRTAEDWLRSHGDRIDQISDTIWGHAELAFQEHHSSKLLADTLEQAGFKVQRG